MGRASIRQGVRCVTDHSTTCPTTIDLVRHGHNPLNVAERMSGRLDTACSPEEHPRNNVSSERVNGAPDAILACEG